MKKKKRAEEALQLTQVSLPDNEKWYSIFRYIKDPIQPSFYDSFAQYTILPNIKDLIISNEHFIIKLPTVLLYLILKTKYIDIRGKLKYSHTLSGVQIDGSFNKISNIY